MRLCAPMISLFFDRTLAASKSASPKYGKKSVKTLFTA